MILFFVDILIYNFTDFNTYLFLLNFINYKNIYKLCWIAIFLDFIIFHTIYKNILIILFMILINKYLLKVNKKNLLTYIVTNILNYSFFIILVNIINKNLDFQSISLFIVNDLMINFILWLIIYKYINESKNS